MSGDDTQVLERTPQVGMTSTFSSEDCRKQETISVTCCQTLWLCTVSSGKLAVIEAFQQVGYL